jgi:hypothetical protein
LTRNSKLS